MQYKFSFLTLKNIYSEMPSHISKTVRVSLVNTYKDTNVPHLQKSANL